MTQSQAFEWQCCTNTKVGSGNERRPTRLGYEVYRETTLTWKTVGGVFRRTRGREMALLMLSACPAILACPAIIACSAIPASAYFGLIRQEPQGPWKLEQAAGRPWGWGRAKSALGAPPSQDSARRMSLRCAGLVEAGDRHESGHRFCSNRLNAT